MDGAALASVLHVAGGNRIFRPGFVLVLDPGQIQDGIQDGFSVLDVLK
jgi:hypothetical protein